MHCDVNETTRGRTLILNCAVTSIEEIFHISFVFHIQYIKLCERYVEKSWSIFYTCVQKIWKSKLKA